MVSQIYALSKSLMMLRVGLHPVFKIIFDLASITDNALPINY